MSEMPTDEGPITRFAMVLTGTPKSSQASPRPLRRYKDDLAETACERMQSRRLFDKRDLYLRIIWFQAMRRSGDVDNIIKPISDALCGVVYPDDKWVAKCASERVELRRDFEISAHTVPDEVYNDLVAAIASGTQDVVYIEVGSLDKRHIIFGPIDGGAFV